MRILFLSPDYPPKVRTGIAAYVHSAASAMARAGETVHVLTHETTGGPPDSVQGGVHVHRRPIMHLPGVRRALRLLPEAWSREHLPQQAMTRPGRRLGLGVTSLVEASRLGVDFDVVEAPDYFCPGWAIALTRRWPVLTVLHTPLEIEIRYSNFPRRAYLAAASGIERRAAGMSAAISAPSTLVREELLEAGWSTVGRASVDPIGVDLRDVPRYPPAHQGNRILIAGHISPRKGHDILACAAGILRSRGRKLEVVSVGSFGLGWWSGRPFREHVEAEITRSGVPWRLLEHRDRPEFLNCYQEASVVVVPSRFESFSIVALEALLAGRPVVVTDRCGIAERFQAGPASGMWVAPAGDPEALSDTIEEVLDHVAANPQAVAEAARTSGETIGNVDALLPRRLALYKTVAGG